MIENKDNLKTAYNYNEEEFSETIKELIDNIINMIIDSNTKFAIVDLLMTGDINK